MQQSLVAVSTKERMFCLIQDRVRRCAPGGTQHTQLDHCARDAPSSYNVHEVSSCAHGLEQLGGYCHRGRIANAPDGGAQSTPHMNMVETSQRQRLLLD